jgi:hypothetical protein
MRKGGELGAGGLLVVTGDGIYMGLWRGIKKD